MKIRSLTIGLYLHALDFAEDGGAAVRRKLLQARCNLLSLQDEFTNRGYVVQTVRVCTNSFQHYFFGSDDKLIESNVELLITLLDELEISFCSIGYCNEAFAIQCVPSILKRSTKLYCSTAIDKGDSQAAFYMGDQSCNNHPDYGLCKLAAEASLELWRQSGDLANFHYCASFSCSENVPFFPAAYNGSKSTKINLLYKQSKTVQGEDGLAPSTEIDKQTLSIALESGDLLFMAFYGADSVAEGSRNLKEALLQALRPVERIAREHCTKLRDLRYRGIDASINPGLALPDSVGAGIESLLKTMPVARAGSGTGLGPRVERQFGNFGTLSCVSAVTAAIKSLQSEDSEESGVTLIGYCGLMLPVMEDLVLAERAAAGAFTLRDILSFSSICGVGLDTVPVAGATASAESLAAVYMETASLAFRLNKPLTCRLLPMTSMAAGQSTSVDSPFLVNTACFSL